MSVRTESGTVVAMRDITIRFPGVLALDGVDFLLRAGEVHALMGENGPGESPVIKALTGVCAIDGRSIPVRGRPDLLQHRGRPGGGDLDGLPRGQPLPEPVRGRE